MMKSGGYVAASERMGIDLNARTLKDNEYYERINPTVGLDMQKKADKDGFLTLGRYRSALSLSAKQIFKKTDDCGWQFCSYVRSTRLAVWSHSFVLFASVWVRWKWVYFTRFPIQGDVMVLAFTYI